MQRELSLNFHRNNVYGPILGKKSRYKKKIRYCYMCVLYVYTLLYSVRIFGKFRGFWLNFQVPSSDFLNRLSLI